MSLVAAACKTKSDRNDSSPFGEETLLARKCCALVIGSIRSRVGISACIRGSEFNFACAYLDVSMELVKRVWETLPLSLENRLAVLMSLLHS